LQGSSIREIRSQARYVEFFHDPGALKKQKKTEEEEIREMNTAVMRYGRAAALALVGAPIMAITGSSQAQNAGPSQAQKALKIVMVPKFTGTAYFAATEKGAKEAVAELKEKGVAIDFLYTGPSVANTDEEVSIIDDLVAQKPDAIIMAASDADKLVPVAKKAKDSGIKVITYDGDVADPNARQWFVNQGTFAQAGAALVDVVAEQAGTGARFAVVSTSPGAFSQDSWIGAMKAQMQAKYPKMRLVDIGYGQNKPTESFNAAQNLINKFRDQLDAIVVPSVVALPKVAEAVEQAGLTGKIVVTGMSTPNQIREFVKRGTVKTVVLWNPVDLGYLAVYAAQASLAGTLEDNATQARVPAGRLGTRDAVTSLEDITAKGRLTLKNVIVLGNPFRFSKDNIDQFNF
jgi:rhamnose transport system substrate-binding protein